MQCVCMSQYSLIYADPPWSFTAYDQTTGLDRAPDAHYSTLDTAGISAIKPSANADALLAMWVYDPMLPDAITVAEAWGFKFITVLFRWLKTGDPPGQLRLFPMEEKLSFGMGYHTRGGGCEECWLFKRGKGLPVLNHGIRKEFFSPRREHSRKPDEVPGWLIDLYGDVPRLEMFARTRRPGWDAFGNETEKF